MNREKSAICRQREELLGKFAMSMISRFPPDGIFVKVFLDDETTPIIKSERGGHALLVLLLVLDLFDRYRRRRLGNPLFSLHFTSSRQTEHLFSFRAALASDKINSLSLKSHKTNDNKRKPGAQL